MSGSDAPSDTWTSLIIHFASRLTSPNEEAITSEDQFREAFTALCTKYKEIEIQRLLTRVRRQHAQIISFAAAIDATNRFDPPACLGTLVWQLLTRAIHVRSIPPSPARVRAAETTH
jgi:hypothetical protein